MQPEKRTTVQPFLLIHMGGEYGRQWIIVQCICFAWLFYVQGDLTFMPSIGLEFITQMTVHAADYVEAGLEMHTNMYHEHSLNAKVTINRNQIRLSIPAPKSNTQLFSFRLVEFTSPLTISPRFENMTWCSECYPHWSFHPFLLSNIATSWCQSPLVKSWQCHFLWWTRLTQLTVGIYSKVSKSAPLFITQIHPPKTRPPIILWLLKPCKWHILISIIAHLCGPLY